MTYILAVLIVALAVGGMALGVIFGKTRIHGSCGGLANMRDKHGNVTCSACSHPSPDCTGNPEDHHADDDPADAKCAVGSHADEDR